MKVAPIPLIIIALVLIAAAGGLYWFASVQRDILF